MIISPFLVSIYMLPNMLMPKILPLISSPLTGIAQMICRKRMIIFLPIGRADAMSIIGDPDLGA